MVDHLLNGVQSPAVTKLISERNCSEPFLSLSSR